MQLTGEMGRSFQAVSNWGVSLPNVMLLPPSPASTAFGWTISTAFCRGDMGQFDKAADILEAIAQRLGGRGLEIEA